ncbi:MAG: DUF3089 domain-containing protein [Synergistaceae bacterium]|nr:DUF3089 domain-containing protein [Synergistaceae bacterium]
MKKISTLTILGVMAFGLTACSAADNAGKAPDYSQKSSWHKIPAAITKDVDTFYINSTVYIFGSLKEDSPEYAALDNEEMLAGFVEEYMSQASAYEESTNVFVPYYRQAGMRVMKKSWQETGDVDAAISGIPYSDITAALDYYFENCNGGRPFIIAGHSQGSAITRLVLKKYFKEHPDYYKRMIAAYVIGYSVTKDDLKAYPHLKFATGESDTGVIISWNTEGKENVEGSVKTAVLLPGAISINPLNWKLDETYAPASENLGSFVTNEKTGEPEIADIGADAQIVLSRGTVVTNAKPDPMPEEAARITAEYFGPGARHDNDYTFYYNNIKNNVAKRIAAYKANSEKAPDYSRKDCWYKLPEITKDVDTFYIYATEYMGFNKGDPEYATLDNEEMLKGVEGQYLLQASAYEEATNVFVPYYRQSGLRYAGEVWKNTGSLNSALLGFPYEDVTAALDYYFENCNGGRPFILAGHSQGSAIAKIVLEKYFKEHPEYYKRMIAAYVIGYAVTKDDLAANPHWKFATGETDTGVIISWNTEGRKNVEANVKTAVLFPGAISINPLNWKLDDTYAPASENLGSLVLNEEAGKLEIGDVGADAQVVPERGTVVTNAKVEPMPAELAAVASEFFGPDGRHESDYTFYYNNIKNNVAKRVAAYKAKRN